MSPTLTTVPRSAVLPFEWDAFVQRHPSGWLWHTDGWVEYGLAFGGDREDLSFAVLDGAGEVVGVCPLIREADRCAFEGEPGVWPLGIGWKDEVGNEVAIEAVHDALIGGIRAAKVPASFRSCPLVQGPSGEFHSAVPVEMRIGWRSRVLDLTQSVDALHAGLRKSYKNLISRGEKRYEILADHEGALDCEYEAVHRASVGRVAPRPAETYRMQARWVERHRAFLVGALAGGRWVAFAYVFVWKGGAYYGSGPSLEPSAMHAVVWRAILEAKALGCTRMELGWQGHAAPTDTKEHGIEKFKRGFGGDDLPIWVMEVMS